MAGRNYSLPTIKALFAEAATCAYPGCESPLVFRDRGAATVVAQIAHIRSERKNGPRYEESYVGDVDGEENLILLCGTHHPPVDRHESLYTVEELLEWKAAQRAEAGGGTTISEADARRLARLSDDERAVLIQIAKTSERVVTAAEGVAAAVAEVEVHRDMARRQMDARIGPMYAVHDDGTRERIHANLPYVDTMRFDELSRQAWLKASVPLDSALNSLREEAAVLRMMSGLGLAAHADEVVKMADTVRSFAPSPGLADAAEGLRSAVACLWSAANGEGQ